MGNTTPTGAGTGCASAANTAGRLLGWDAGVGCSGSGAGAGARCGTDAGKRELVFGACIFVGAAGSLAGVNQAGADACCGMLAGAREREGAAAGTGPTCRAETWDMHFMR